MRYFVDYLPRSCSKMTRFLRHLMTAFLVQNKIHHQSLENGNTSIHAFFEVFLGSQTMKTGLQRLHESVDITCPLRYNKSKAKIHTWIVTFSVVTSYRTKKIRNQGYLSNTFRFLVLKTWNGRIHFFSLSHATASQSSTYEVTFSFENYFFFVPNWDFLKIVF